MLIKSFLQILFNKGGGTKIGVTKLFLLMKQINKMTNITVQRSKKRFKKGGGKMMCLSF